MILRNPDNHELPNANRQGSTLIEGNRWRLPYTAPHPSVLYAEAVELYPLQRPLLGVGLVAGLVALVLQDWIVALCIFTLFNLVGASWRTDMVPIIPACMAFLWLSPAIGYIYYYNFGVWPGVDTVGALTTSIPLSMAGLAAIVFGMRLAFAVFRKTILAKTLAPASNYDIQRVFWITIGVFAISYVFDVLPMQLWFGGAQMITNVLALRFVFYFILLVTVFQHHRGYTYAGWATVWVIGPQLLTGFSNFKEILFVVLIAALIQWRPWIKTPQQSRQNRRIFLFSTLGGALLLTLGLIWTGGVKDQWRNEIWRGEVVTTSPTERMFRFLEITDGVTRNIDFAAASEALAARFSSGSVYFSYVIDRVPQFIPFEDGRLFALAFANATQPRFLFPDKPNLGGDSWLVQRYAGVAAAGDEVGASIGLGFLAEFYVDFGMVGTIGLAALWGLILGAAIALLAKVSPSREFFLVFVISVATAYFMAFDASFIKTLAGFLQRVLVISALFLLIGRPVQRWLTASSKRPPQVSGPQPLAGHGFRKHAIGSRNGT